MPENTISVWSVSNENAHTEAFYQQGLLLLPDFLQTEIKQYKHRETALNSLIGKLLVRFVCIKNQLPFSLNDWKIDDKERPSISVKIDFNISHSGKYIVLAFAQERVGIDVEKHRKISIDLFRKYFSDAEWQSIQASTNPEKQFFDFWAIKESAIKCNGKGVEVLSQTIIQNEQHVACVDDLFYYQFLPLHPEYSCALTIIQPLQITWNSLNADEIIC